MAQLRIAPPDDDAALADWRHVHNTIIPSAPLSAAEVRERAGRNRLEVAYLGDGPGTLVGCTTVRPPKEGPGPAVATVIARILPDFRRRGFGTLLYTRGLAQARELGAEVIETVVWTANEDGLRFALRRGFTAFDRYLLPGDDVEWVDLRLTGEAAPERTGS
ncbi:N-acetylglutamate synthase, GNAT family [Actinacidiphila yanglinensis]|uniref:N-acetylglutamate synthase, GNAT family n=1 Tax=Actinacidiphila yanglinensis TaxID=310779 RepID=A0A1H5S8J9_9ACTN|nr:GNAT family N-acetyltransferase [Actinacidiphila yanglinensis]SEF46151.1 N-acetylglutamate synthase, GNAT family [Actinacidiphila yanglinensis]